MAKKVKTAAWSLVAERVSGPQICSLRAAREPNAVLESMVWIDDAHLVTLDSLYRVQRWRRDGALLASRDLALDDAIHWRRGLSYLPGGALVAFSGSSVWLLDPDDLSVRWTGPMDGAAFMIDGQLITSDNASISVYALEGGSPIVLRTQPLPAAHRCVVQDPWLVSPDGAFLGAHANGCCVLLDWRAGRRVDVPPQAMLCGLASGEALLELPDHTILTLDLASGEVSVVEAAAPRKPLSTTRGAAGWVRAEWDRAVAAPRLVRCVDAQGRAIWERHLGDMVQQISASPDGAVIAVRSARRVIFLDAATGEARFDADQINACSALALSAGKLLIMAYERHPRLLPETSAQVLDLATQRLSPLSLPLGVPVGDTLYGLSWIGGQHMLASLDLSDPAQPPTPIAPSHTLFTNLCAARGHIYYDHYKRGAWELIHAGPDAARVWAEASLDTLKRAQPGPCVIASEAAGLIAATNGAGHTVVYEAETGAQRWLLAGLTKGRVVGAFSADGASLILANQSKIFCWDMASGEVRWKGKTGAELRCCALIWGGAGVLVTTPTGALMAYDVATGALRATAQLDLPELNAIAVSDDDRLYMVCQSYQLYAAQLPST